MSWNYAKLGSACHPSMRVLSSNRKYLLPDDKVYDETITKMYQYPGMHHDYITTVGEPRYPEDIKTQRPEESHLRQIRHELYTQPTCCGKK